ncbi:MAG: SurA N-terminal domain-containing protein [Verrucomicrobiota bacterium]|nr:SurA N-terminal domain-containing protein [Limisphaera sp.]MDW8380963.1 SurA N-terminal domain-containing protein [Verrucomicrobiota bacterium]
MFGTIRKHQTWLWAIIIAVTVVAFVIYFNPSTQFGDHRPVPELGRVRGEKVTRDKLLAARREVMLHYLVRTGRWPDEHGRDVEVDLDREAYARLLLLQLVREWKLEISPTVTARLAQEILRGFGGENQSLPLDAWVKQVLAPRGFTLADFERFVRHEAGLQMLVNLVTLPGQMVLPTEARALYEREHQELSVQVVRFLAVNYLPQVTVTTQAVAQFYTNQMARYRIPERVQVSFVAFPISNYWAAAEAELVRTNLDEIVQANLDRLGTNYVQFGATPEAAREKIREELIRRQAQMLARRAANEFATVLFDREPVRPENLKMVAAERGLEVKTLEPFSEEQGPKELNGGTEFIRAAFRISGENPFSAPVVTSEAVYVLGFERRLPSEIPPLESMLSQVLADFRYEQAVHQARQAAEHFRSILTNQLAQGRSFVEVCTASNLHPVLLPPFSWSTRSLSQVEQDLPLTQFKQVAFATPVGGVSPVVPTRDGALLVFVQERLPLDLERMNRELPGFTDYLRRLRQNDLFNEWFRRQAEMALRETPLARRAVPQIQASEEP